MQNLYSWTQREALNAIPHIIRAQAGLGWPDDPCAQDLLRMGKPLLDVMKQATGADRQEPASQFVARAMATMDDLKQSLTTAFDGVVAPIVATMRSHHAALADVPVDNFYPVRVAQAGASDLEEVPEHAEYSYNLTGVADALEAVGLKSYGTLFGASRQAMMGSDFEPVLARVRDAALAAMRNEKILLAAALESTANTSDGSPIFHSSFGNLLASGSGGGLPSVTTLDNMFKAMANLQNPAGGKSGVLPRYIIAPPALAATSLVCTQAVFGDVLRPIRVDVIVNEFLSSDTTWYAVADPVVAPSFGMVRLGRQAERRTWRVEQVQPFAQDGLYWRLSQDVRIIRMSRYAVKVTS